MGITDKFGNFQIKKSDRISQEDQAWLTHREELYKRAIAVYKSVYDIYKAENESYSEEDRKNYNHMRLLHTELMGSIQIIEDLILLISHVI